MKLFVNDIPINIVRQGPLPDHNHFNSTINGQKDAITKSSLIHHVLLFNATIDHLDIVFELIHSMVPVNLLSLEIIIDDYESIRPYLKSKFKIVHAAGGLVRKKEKYLMIYRLKRWDLPKGKREDGERNKQTAKREVEEECNIEVKLGEKICTTWHTYTMNKRNMIKKTRWYTMDSIDDAKMKPSIEEDIEDVRWMTQKEVYHALEDSYNSIRYVFESFYKIQEGKSEGLR